jgi:hypothetical protein
MITCGAKQPCVENGFHNFKTLHPNFPILYWLQTCPNLYQTMVPLMIVLYDPNLKQWYANPQVWENHKFILIEKETLISINNFKKVHFP